jgi:NAD(P)-dependent dehydrogenase (short-subunit alcohol dehydrogenase family)
LGAAAAFFAHAAISSPMFGSISTPPAFTPAAAHAAGYARAVSKTILVCGYGPGISSSVARRFGAQGYRVALVARSADKLEAGCRALGEAGVAAQAFPCDLADPDAVARMVDDVRERFGPVHTLHWNAYGGGAGDIATASVAALRRTFDIGVTGAVVAVQHALPDLKAQQGAVLITGGGFAYYADQVDKMVVGWGVMDVAVVKAAQHKLTGVLHHKLAADGIYVGTVVVLGMVRGTAFDHARDGSGLDPDAIADAFWKLATERSTISVNFPG